MYYDIVSGALLKGYVIDMKLYGYCMRPIINNGDLAQISPVEYDELSVGDIVVYGFNDKLKIHRLIKKVKWHGNNVFVTKGDKSKFIDTPVSSNRLIGRVTKVYKNQQVLNLTSYLWRLINYLLVKHFISLKMIKRFILISKILLSRMFQIVFKRNFRSFFSLYFGLTFMFIKYGLLSC